MMMKMNKCTRAGARLLDNRKRSSKKKIKYINEAISQKLLLDGFFAIGHAAAVVPSKMMEESSRRSVSERATPLAATSRKAANRTDVSTRCLLIPADIATGIFVTVSPSIPKCLPCPLATASSLPQLQRESAAIPGKRPREHEGSESQLPLPPWSRAAVV